MSALFEPGVLRVLLASETFAPALAWYGGWLAFTVVLASAGVAWLLRRRRSARELHGCESGSSIAVDLVITLPLFMSVLMVMIELTSLLNSTLHVHYAAFAAARAARVHAFEAGYGGLYLNTTPQWTTGPDSVEQKALEAAQIALMAASPSDPSISGAANDAWIQKVAQASSLSDPQAYVSAMQGKLGYARAHTQVTGSVRQPTMFGGITNALIYEVEVEVTYEAYVHLVPGRAIFADQTGGEFTTLRAVVRML